MNGPPMHGKNEIGVRAARFDRDRCDVRLNAVALIPKLADPDSCCVPPHRDVHLQKRTVV
jgi:hypothetical protein